MFVDGGKVRPGVALNPTALPTLRCAPGVGVGSCCSAGGRPGPPLTPSALLLPAIPIGFGRLLTALLSLSFLSCLSGQKHVLRGCV
eukprot:365681-Chlamydomonas_euryale.AAC.3